MCDQIRRASQPCPSRAASLPSRLTTCHERPCRAPRPSVSAGRLRAAPETAPERRTGVGLRAPWPCQRALLARLRRVGPFSAAACELRASRPGAPRVGPELRGGRRARARRQDVHFVRVNSTQLHSTPLNSTQLRAQSWRLDGTAPLSLPRELLNPFSLSARLDARSRWRACPPARAVRAASPSFRSPRA